MKQTFFHFKDEKGNERARKTSDSVKQIQSDMIGNGCVLDAIYYEETGKVTIYNKHCGYSKSDFYANLIKD